MPPKATKSYSSPIPSTSSTDPKKESGNPGFQYLPDDIQETSQEEIIPQIKSLVEGGTPYEKILAFYLDRRSFNHAQSKKWLEKVNDFRQERSLSSVPGDVATADPSCHIRKSEEVEEFYNRLYKSWIKETAIVKVSETELAKDETSSDSCSEERPAHEQSTSKLPRKGSWKEFKRTKHLDDILIQDTENAEIKKVVKITAKELWKQKKKAQKREKDKVIVDNVEVADMMYEVTDYMAKRYLPEIERICYDIDPARDDRPDSECESGSYDSQDNFYEHKADKRSKLVTMAMSVDPEVLIRRGLYHILLVTLPLCSSYTDKDQLTEFIKILIDTKYNRKVPKHSTLRGGPSTQMPSKEREQHPVRGKKVVVMATVEPSPSLDTLAGFGEIKEECGDLSQEDDTEFYSSRKKSASESIRLSLERETLKSIGSETSFSWEDEVTGDYMESEVFKDAATPGPTLHQRETRKMEDDPVSALPQQAGSLQLPTSQSMTGIPSSSGGSMKRDRSPRAESSSKKSNL